MDFIRKILIIAFAIGFLILWIPDLLQSRIQQGFAQPNAPSSPARVLDANHFLMLMISYKEAAENYEKAYNLWYKQLDESERGKTAYRTAFCFEKAGNEKKARDWYNYYLKTFPKHIWYEQGKARLDRLDAA